jgi:hypothetical protein
MIKINLLEQIYLDNEAKKENLVKRLREAEATAKVQREKEIKDLCSKSFKDLK